MMTVESAMDRKHSFEDLLEEFVEDKPTVVARLTDFVYRESGESSAQRNVCDSITVIPDPLSSVTSPRFSWFDTCRSESVRPNLVPFVAGVRTIWHETGGHRTIRREELWSDVQI